MSGGDPREGERIARLLDEIKAAAGPGTWQKVEELVRRLVALYGDGLGRVLALARETGALDPARLCADELVSSLLLLHGLHPLPTGDRVSRAVAVLRDRLPPDVALELVGLGEDGVVRLRVSGAGACGIAAAALARGIEHAILEAAPEVARVDIEGASTAPRAERLVTIGRPRDAEVTSR
jgi:Fe-S cluster biogenesis protein NfuA